MKHIDARLREIVERYFGMALDREDPLWEKIEPLEIEGGEWLFHEGDPGDSLYFLILGRLQAWLGVEGAKPGPEARLLGEIAPGESVGELGVLTAGPRTAGIRAIRHSKLIRLKRSDFEELSHRHPALAIRVGGIIASRLHQRTAVEPPTVRNLGAVAILPLDDTPGVRDFTDALAGALARRGRTVDLAAAGLGEAGAPVASLGPEDEVGEDLRHWLADQEEASRFLLYRSDAADTPWTRFAARQCDLALIVAEADGDPAARAWEEGIGLTQGSSTAHRLMVLLQPGSSGPIRGTAEWLAEREVEGHLHVRADRDDDLERVARVIAGEAVGLVLGAGAARGLAQLGIYRAMVELGVPVDWVGGTSIGATLAAAIALDRGPDYAIEVCREAFVVGKPMSDYTLPNISLLRGRRMTRLLHKHLTADIEDLPLPFFCVSSIMDSAIEHVHERGPTWKAVRASASLPGLYPPAVVDRRLAIDGAVLNLLPVDVMKHKPVGRVIAVDVSSRLDREVDYEEMPSPWAVLRGRLLPFARRYKAPGLMSVILKAMEIGALTKARELGAQADLLLTPPVERFGMTQLQAFDRLVEVGYEYAKEPLENWLEEDQA